MKPPRYLNAQEAADLLGINLATLYSYVSRGLIRSESADRARRQRRYHAEDVEALAERKEYRRDPGKAAQSALSYGMPVLDSTLTFIQDGCLYYRLRRPCAGAATEGRGGRCADLAR
jgi:citrate synthase